MAGVFFLIFVGMIFFMQVRFTFVLEDVEFGNNLAYGMELGSLKDIVASIPAIMRKGGSTLSLVLLQLVLLMGDKAANIINMLIILAIAYLISRCSGARRGNLLFIVLPLFLMFSLNSDWKFSYLWEFGLIGYVLPAIPFMVYLYFVIFELAKPQEGKDGIKPLNLVACFCAFLCAWQNAAYGIIALIVGILAIILSYRVLATAGKLWLWISCGSSLAGMIFYLFASGNFHKNSIMSSQYIDLSIFPAVVIALLILAVVLRCGGWLNAPHLLLIGVMCCSVALRFIFQFVPGVSVNGIQMVTFIIAIILFCSLLRSFINEYRKVAVWGYVLALSSFLYMVMTMLEDIGGIS